MKTALRMGLSAVLAATLVGVAVMLFGVGR